MPVKSRRRWKRSPRARTAHWCVRLPREPGKRESRYAHLFGNRNAEPAASEAGVAPSPAGAPPQPPPSVQLSDSQAERLAALEAEVRSLREEIERLKRAS